MKQSKTIYYLLAALLLTTSCNSDEDSWTATLYGDAAIKTFTLGTLNRYVNGVKKTYAGSSYAMEINALTHTIENPDSLPYKTDSTHVICTITTLNNGYLTIKSKTDDSWKVYSATDSIDFSNCYKTPRVFRVIASDGSGYTDYKVKLNVHQQNGDEMVWAQQTSWPWSDPTDIDRYLGKSTYEEYGLLADGTLMHRATKADPWEVDDFAKDVEGNALDTEHFPTQDVALTSYPMTTADSTDCVLLAGTANGKTAVWRKITDNTGKTAKGQWVYMDRGSETAGLLPALTSLSLVSYDGVVLALGKGTDFKTIYESRDNGITWKVSSRITMPASFVYDNLQTMMARTDEDSYLWLQCRYADNSTVVWRGRLNRLGWKK